MKELKQAVKEERLRAMLTHIRAQRILDWVNVAKAFKAEMVSLGSAGLTAWMVYHQIHRGAEVQLGDAANYIGGGSAAVFLGSAMVAWFKRSKK